MPIEERTVTGLEGLLSEVLSIAAALGDRHFLWYRGHSCSNYKLLPKIMRDMRSSDEVFDRERRLLTRFKQRSMPYWSSTQSQSDWEYLFAMQHYGMPTRLLDWTENLFVATYFALNEPTNSNQHDHEGACTPVVWCFDPVEWNRSVPPLSEFGDTIHVITTADEEIEWYDLKTVARRRSRLPAALYGSHNSARIVAQRGTFMVWGNDTSELETIAPSQAGRIWRITVNGDRSELSKSLSRLGFSETMIYPELHMLGTELSRTEGWRR